MDGHTGARRLTRKGQATRDGLQAMRDRGELREGADPRALALAVLTALQGGLLLAQVRRDVAPLATVLDTMLDHIETLTRSTA